MNKKMLTGLIMAFVASIFIGLSLQLSEIARYVCIMSGQEFTFRWFEFLNPVAILCMVVVLAITAYFIMAGYNEIKAGKQVTKELEKTKAE